jgi:hypothetical protein
VGETATRRNGEPLTGDVKRREISVRQQPGSRWITPSIGRLRQVALNARQKQSPRIAHKGSIP